MKFKDLFQKLIIFIVVIAILFAAYNVINSMGGKNGPSPSPTVQVATITATPTATAAALPKYDLTLITVPSCADCFPVDTIAYVLQQYGADVKTTKFAFDSKDGQDLIAKYNITKVPTLIASGDITKIPQFDNLMTAGGEQIDGKWVLKDIAPPYYDINEKKVVGLVSVTTVYAKDCIECARASIILNSATNASMLAAALKGEFYVGIADDKSFEMESKEGKDLIQKYNLTHLPAVIVSKDIEAYSQIAAGFKKIGTIESDGSYVLRGINPPYYNLETKKVEGLISIIYVKSGDYCSPACYDYRMHVQALSEIGIVPDQAYFYDFDSPMGKNVTLKYNITDVPAFVISSEVSKYPAFMTVHSRIGDFAKDGSFVFRNFSVLPLGSYYFNIPTNKTMKTETAVVDVPKGSQVPLPTITN